MTYPKMGTLFRLQAGNGGKWWRAEDALLPETAGLFFIPDEDRVVTEKVDGANMWVAADGTIGKRNGVCDEMDRHYYDAMTRFDYRAARERFGNVTLYGELVGPKVQSSGQLYAERQFVLFDVLGAEGRFFRWSAVKAVAEALGIAHVPEVEGPEGWSFDAVREYVTALQSAVNPDAQAEGIVVRDANDTSPVRRRIAKIRRKDFREESA